MPAQEPRSSRLEARIHPDTLTLVKRAAEMQLGLNLADLKRYDEAIPHLKKLLEADPQFDIVVTDVATRARMEHGAIFQGP